MEEKKLAEYLVSFGLTGQEASVYLELFRSGTSNGYELAKRTGISRSNVYKALEGLSDKGAAYVSEGTSRKFTAVEIEEFCQNKINSLIRKQEFLAAHIPKEKEEAEGYVTIASDKNIADKIRNMLLKAKIKVVVLTSFPKSMDERPELLSGKVKGIKVYVTSDKKNQVGIITDSRYVLSGELGKGRDSTCLYTGQANFVQIFKDSMKNEIRLLELEGNSVNRIR